METSQIWALRSWSYEQLSGVRFVLNSVRVNAARSSKYLYLFTVYSGAAFSRSSHLHGRREAPMPEQSPTMYSLALLFLIVTLSFTCTLAHENGMDMNMDQGMSMSTGNSVMYLHFTPGDNLWFLGWAPRTAGAMVGACIGLFMLALAERWLSAMQAVMAEHWRTRSQIVLANNLNTYSVASEEYDKPTTKSSQPSRGTLRRRVPPFIPSHDVPRGIMQVVLVSINFLFMLAIMTFQLGFIFAIIIGLGVGETLFGRYRPHSGHLH